MNNMNLPLSLVLLEDHPPDAELIVRALRRGGYEPAWTVATTEEEFLQALAQPPDVILADSSLPLFSMTRAIALLTERGLEIPVITVSGRSEDAAAECIGQGATDYVSKDDLDRLPAAVGKVTGKQAR
jgi:CheY-like chemotaxis protein